MLSFSTSDQYVLFSSGSLTNDKDWCANHKVSSCSDTRNVNIHIKRLNMQLRIQEKHLFQFINHPNDFLQIYDIYLRLSGYLHTCFLYSKNISTPLIDINEVRSLLVNGFYFFNILMPENGAILTELFPCYVSRF